jgi:hypothetical protein
VKRSGKGQAVWVVDDELEPRRELAETLVDSDEILLPREIGRKLRRDFGP